MSACVGRTPATMASERSALVGTEAEQLRRDQQDDNRPWAAALAFGACALLVLIMAP